MMAIRTVIRIIIYGFTRRSSGRARTDYEIVAGIKIPRARNV